MTTTISEKDKKLLIKLAIGLAIFGLVYCLILPLYGQNTKLKQQIADEERIQQDNALKLRTLAAVELVTMENEETLLNASKQFYPVMSTTEIDNEITSMLMKYDLTAKDLDIRKISRQDNTTLKPYQVKGEDEETDSEDEEDEEEDERGGPYKGLYTAKVTLSVTGGEEDLQRFLDANINAGARQRVVSFRWSRQGDERNGLSISLELYMCEDIEEFLAAALEQEEEE